MLTFPDASDLLWGCCLTQVPKEVLVAGLSFMDMSHEPLAFLSGVFRGSQLCWPTVDKESFAILFRGLGPEGTRNELLRQPFWVVVIEYAGFRVQQRVEESHLSLADAHFVSQKSPCLVTTYRDPTLFVSFSCIDIMFCRWWKRETDNIGLW